MEKKDCVKLQGAKFVLLNEQCREVACGVTDSHGRIQFECLPLGKYFIKEIEAPGCYEIDDDLCEVVICCRDSHAHVEVVNRKKKGDICVTLFGKDC